ncbi:MAG TPA: T9SS type A sorting domain-containing protein [Puia sp.]|nr:T9SS type A sorting domain-containing protein [Puia sp.]
MRRSRIQLSGVTLLLLLCWGALKPLPSAAQTCSGTLQSTTYSTSVSGSGNNTYSPVFPQYSPPAGYTLLAAVLSSTITVVATLDVSNSGGATTSKLGVTDEDIVQLNGSDITDASGNDISDVSVAKNLGTFAIPTGNTTIGPTTAFSNKQVVYDSLTTANGLLNSFIGSGNLNLTYSNSSGYSTTASVTVTPTFSVSAVFALTYYYCYTGPLAADILTFTATRENDQHVSLNWLTTNENAGRKYIVEVSPGGGGAFSDLATLPADPLNSDASYSYDYIIRATDKGKLYFRLKLVNADGTIAYSPLRIIDLSTGTGTGSGFSIYPNPPTDYINLVFPPAAQGWQVDILAADGSLVQRNYYSNISTGRLSFQRPLSAGTYFARATDLQAAKSYVAPFVIH